MNDIFYISVSFNAEEDKVAMITALLMAKGFEGAEETETEMIVSILESMYDKIVIDEIFEGFGISYQAKKIKQQNWNAAWESSFEPVLVDDFVSVRASFHESEASVKHDIIITPKMSFGTGHHATTYLMMEEMQSIDFHGKTVVDFGTGTGVLAILAEKMGATEVQAIDNDEWSIANAKENFKANNCFKIELTQDYCLRLHNKADVILANINLNIIINNMESLKKHTKPGGVLLLSGLLISDKDKICKELTDQGFAIIKISEKNNWIVIYATL